MAGEDHGSTTVAFELAALERLRDPGEVFGQTRGWARSVGIVSDRPTYALTNAARAWGMDYGFHSGPRSLLESLLAIRAQPEQAADRYLLIGTDAVDADAVAERGWAFLEIEEAAEAAGWVLTAPDAVDEPDPADDGWP